MPEIKHTETLITTDISLVGYTTKQVKMATSDALWPFFFQEMLNAKR